MPVDLPRRCAAETLGTALLLAIVVGSGIMAERLCGGNEALALLCNALATGAGLFALIHTFGPVSGAHLNPVVSAVDASGGGLSRAEALAYVLAQCVGALLGVALAHAMFGLAPLQAAAHARSGPALWLSEAVATFGLVGTILGVSRRTPGATPAAVAAYIVGAYWFTSSTSFANPAVTLARAFTDTFAGIALRDVPGFVASQVVGAGAAALVFRWLVPVGGPESRP